MIVYVFLCCTLGEQKFQYNVMISCTCLKWTDTGTTAVRDVLEWFVANQPLKILPGGNIPLNNCGNMLMSFYFGLIVT